MYRSQIYFSNVIETMLADELPSIVHLNFVAIADNALPDAGTEVTTAYS